ncbi:MAG: MmcQ/YjbR family DNA-binding protein [Planctomycetes bacterium]|nr:MmcQ/YjbR family DNA-binding protein [Planctomycetota bacterium]MCC7170332.1 MmcQ/YjbR family DNA-binding protein [Planctomycetota bacterium]
MTKSSPRSSVLKKLLAHALAMPGAWEDHPWDHTVAKVGKKIFVSLGSDADGLISMSVKLPASAKAALAREDCEPTGYGLGKSGWVTLVATKDSFFPPRMLEGWIEESWCAVAPKREVARWMGVGADEDVPARKRTPKARSSKSRKRIR